MKINLNYKRGLFRLWAVCAIAWVFAISFIHNEEIVGFFRYYFDNEAVRAEHKEFVESLCKTDFFHPLPDASPSRNKEPLSMEKIVQQELDAKREKDDDVLACSPPVRIGDYTQTYDYDAISLCIARRQDVRLKALAEIEKTAKEEREKKERDKVSLCIEDMESIGPDWTIWALIFAPPPLAIVFAFIAFFIWRGVLKSCKWIIRGFGE